MSYLVNAVISLPLLFLGIAACATAEPQSSASFDKYPDTILVGTIAARMGEYWVHPDACESTRSMSIAYTHPFETKGFLISLYKSHDRNSSYAFLRVKTLNLSEEFDNSGGYAEQLLRTYSREISKEEFDFFISNIDFELALSSGRNGVGSSRNLDGGVLVGRISLCNTNGLFYVNEGDDDFELIRKSFQPLIVEANRIFPDLNAVIGFVERE